MPGTTARRDTRLQQLLVVCGICVLGFNLRPAALSVGPVLGELRASLGMSATTAGVLTSLPVLAFAVFGAAAPRLARAIGVHRTTLLALLAVVVGLALRATVDEAVIFLALSLLALAGMAAANVLLPSLVRLHFPQRVGVMTSVYTTALAVGLTTSSVLTVPVSDAAGSWRWGLAAWAVTALLAALPWVALVRHDPHVGGPASSIGLADVARTRLGWALALTFALQSAQAYAVFGWFAELFGDAGFSPGEAGLLLGVVTAVSIPLSVLVPYLAGRTADHTRLILVLLSCYVVGYGGLLVDPAAAAWLWAGLVGAGTSIFPLVLAQIGLRSRTAEGTAALSGFTQSVGYLLAAPGPLAVGYLHERTGGWTAPLLLLLAIDAVLAFVALQVAREQYLEDQLRPGATTPATRSP